VGPAHPGRAARRRAGNRTGIKSLRLCDILGEGFFAPSPQLPLHLVRHRMGGKGRCGAPSGVPGVSVPPAHREGALAGTGVALSVIPGTPGVESSPAGSADEAMGPHEGPEARTAGSGVPRVEPVSSRGNLKKGQAQSPVQGMRLEQA